jgi:NAD(P)-dependent dehydrogenase (short-subunit alcohol dehydrogenase family)
MTWRTDDIPDLTGKRAVITGVTGGLGLSTAIELARHGADLVVTARNSAKAEEAVARIEKDAPGAKVDVVSLDLASLADAKRAAGEVIKAYDRVDILINNAGVMATPKSETVDGFELQIATNHLGHFAWTATLWPLLVSSSARVVTVSSFMHKSVSDIDLRSLTKEGSPRRYGRWKSYGESKLADLLFALELDRRTKASGVPVVSVAAHPGYASTNLTKPASGSKAMFLPGVAMHQVSKVLGQPAAHGAWPLLMAATDPELTGGEYVGPSGFSEMRGRPKLVGMSRTAKDKDLAAALWTASESATGIHFDV